MKINRKQRDSIRDSALVVFVAAVIITIIDALWGLMT